MARRKQSEMDDVATRDKLLQSGKQYFLEYGFQAAPLRKIAGDAGFTSGAFYGYFSTKEDLFYALTDQTASGFMELLDGIRQEMLSLPKEKQLSGMCSVYVRHIPELVDFVTAQRDEIDLIVNASKGTKYEDFKSLIKRRNAENITQAASAGDSKVQVLPEIITEVLMDGYIDMLFRLVLSGKDKETTCRCLEAIAYVYETGMIGLMKKEK